jgi:hypothetical protein
VSQYDNDYKETVKKDQMRGSARNFMNSTQKEALKNSAINGLNNSMTFASLPD